jgi:glucokinase
MQAAYLAIDAGGTYIKSAVSNKEALIFEDSGFMVNAHSDGSKEEILQDFKEIILNGLAYISSREMTLEGIGFAFPGPFDYSNGVSLMKHKYLNIYGIDLRECFRKVPGVVPDIPIIFIHDASAMLTGELLKGNAYGFGNTALLSLGTGLGFTFSINGFVQFNDLGGPKITIYKLPYKDGILEDYISRRGILKSYCEISGKDISDIEVIDIARFADEGDKAAISAFSEVGRVLAESLHNILIKYNIQCLLFGGQISRSFHYMEESLKEGLKDISCLSKISMVKSIDHASLLGVSSAIAKNDLKVSSSV